MASGADPSCWQVDEEHDDEGEEVDAKDILQQTVCLQPVILPCLKRSLSREGQLAAGCHFRGGSFVGETVMTVLSYKGPNHDVNVSVSMKELSVVPKVAVLTWKSVAGWSI